MLKNLLAALFLIVFLGCFVENGYSQKKPTKVITGIITDAENGEAIPGATVVIQGTTIGVVSSFDGKFSIEVPSSKSVLSIAFVGYDIQQIPVDTKQVINVSLKATISQVNEVVVTAQAKGQKNAIKQQINSNTLKNVVAADRLQENPDANAVEAIGRLPGISVKRDGGEGSGLVIRGLEPRYTSVTLNGIQLPSTSGSDRGTNLGGISQYALQGAEVFKSLTADMEANSVAGTVNLKLREAPNDFHVNLMAQKGYNNLNDYYGNYKYLGEFSNRFFGNRLGMLFTASAERVNRSTQTMSAGYGIDGTDPNGDILLNSVNLNNITSIITRRSALLSLDYKVSPGTTLMFYGMYNNSKNEKQTESKGYGISGAGSVNYNFTNTPNDRTDIYQTSISGESKLKFLDIKTDYGIAYSRGKNVNSGERTYNFAFDNASTAAITNIEHRKMEPSEIIKLFTDDPDKLLNCWLTGIGMNDHNINDKNLNAYLNFTIPFKIGSMISGTIKMGGMYREKKRFRDDTVGSVGTSAGGNVYAPKVLADSLNWGVINPQGNFSAMGLSTGQNVDFLNGKYKFGNQFDFNRLNQISTTWEKISDYYFAQGPAVYLPIFGDKTKIGYAQDMQGMMINDQDIKETYSAGYMMSEINFGKHLMFLPGIRLEKTQATMQGFYAQPPQYPPNIYDPVPGKDTADVRSDQYILPMIHMRIKPTDSFYLHLAFTQTLSRPDFNTISPNYFVNTGYLPFKYIAGSPHLKPELWTNYDAQFTYHDDKVGFLSVTAFYKSVKDKIWNRYYKRIKGDPLIAPFPDNAVIDVTVWENRPYKGYVQGVEVDWQTSFHYLPKPFSYLTLSANFTYTDSKTTYPYSINYNKIIPGVARPVPARLDTVSTGPMLYQPKNLANVSLGYNKKGFNAWLSFQYNGQIFTSKNDRGTPRLDAEKDHFYRYDLQLTQKFAIRKVKGFEVLANVANLSNFTETQKNYGDPRPTYVENYGWTADLGLRFRF